MALNDRPLAGRLVYVETSMYVADFLQYLAPVHLRSTVESLCRSLHLDVVVAKSRTVPEGDDPIPLAERGFQRDRIAPDMIGCRIVQGYALATWTPFYYPLDGNWRGWDLDSGMRTVHLWIEQDRPPWEIWDPPRRLDHPLDDLRLWVGAATEKAYVKRVLEAGADDLGMNPRLYPPAWDLIRLQLGYRRDHQAGGLPVWNTDKLLPEPLRTGGWSMFVCHAADYDLIPAPNLAQLRRFLADARA